MTTTLLRTAVAVLDEAGRVVVIFSGADANEAADEWRGAGYCTEPFSVGGDGEADR